MNNKFNSMLNDYLGDTSEQTNDDLENKLQEFVKKYNNGEFDYVNSIKDDAYDLLEQAENAKFKKQALKLAKEAYNMCPDCFDALLFQVDLEENSIKRDELLKEGLEFEKARLIDEGYFEKENIGKFYGLFETRPYIRGLHAKLNYLLIDGKYKQARDLCNEILKLNNNDNLGARYLLMSIYALLEEEKEMLNLYKKYSEECFEMLFPQFVLYYKIGQDNKAKEMLKRINKCNSNFIKFFKGTLKQNPDIMDGYYSKGDSSEIIMYFNQYDFLLNTIPNIDEYVLKNSK